MADELDLDVAPGDLSEECRLFLRERYRGRSLPPNLSGILNQTEGCGAQTLEDLERNLTANAQGQQAGAAKGKKPASEQKQTQSGDAQTSQASGSGVKANAQGQQAGAAKEKKPAPEQKQAQSGGALPSQASGSDVKANAQGQQAGAAKEKKPAPEQKQTQSGGAQTSQASGSGVKANAQGQQAGGAKEKKPAPEQKATRTQRKRKPEDEELVAKRNKCYELRSEYNKYRVEFRHFQDHRTANRQKAQIKHTYGQLQTQIKNYKLFVEKKKLDIDEDILNLDKLITGTKENNYQKTVEEEECENTEKEPQISIAKNNEDTYNIIIKIPK